MFCADHNRDLEGAYGAALRDFESRKDVYSFDTLAWVCLKRGDNSEALAAINKATATGSKDPEILYHAGMIYAANGKSKAAASFLHEALAIDPKFNALAVEAIDSTLKEVIEKQ